MRVISRYVMPFLLVVGAVPQALQEDWSAVVMLVSAAITFVSTSMYVGALDRVRTAFYRSGYARGVVTALEVTHHHRVTGEQIPIPVPDVVTPDDDRWRP